MLLIEGTTMDDHWEDKHKQKRVTKYVRVDTYRVLSRGLEKESSQEMPPMTAEELAEFFGET